MDATHEEWRPVVGYEGSYEVSSLGRVRSLDRYVHHKPKERAAYTRLHRGRMLAPETKKGYSVVVLCDDESCKPHAIHRLVLTAFDGEPRDGMECCHNNGDRSDNRLGNLRWGSRSENMNDKIVHGTHHEAAKAACPRGHPYDYVYWTASGGIKRGCKTCRRESNQRSIARRSESRI